jgi:hypothetical protein
MIEQERASSGLSPSAVCLQRHPPAWHEPMTNVGSRRIFLLATHPGEGRPSQLTAAVQAWRTELVFVPLSRTFAVSTGLASWLSPQLAISSL